MIYIRSNNIGRCLLVLALGLVALGCSDELYPDANNQLKEDANTAVLEFNAFIDGGTNTRTSMGDLKDERYPLLWSEGDKVKVFDTRYNIRSTEATLLRGANSNKAVFKGKLWSTVKDFDDVQFMSSVYPAEGAMCTIDKKESGTGANGSKYEQTDLTIMANLPSVQPYQAGTFANNVFPMIGTCTNFYDFHYDNMAGVLQLPVKGNGTVSKIILTGNNGEEMAGNFTMKFDYYLWNPDVNGNKDVVTIDYKENQIAADNKEAACGRLIAPVDGKSTGIITIDCGENGLKLNPSKPTMVNIVMLPTTFKKGFSVRFVDKDNGGSFVKNTSQTITVKRSYVKAMEPFDYQKPEPLEPANCYIVDKAGYFMIPAFCMGNRPKSARLNVDEKGCITNTTVPVEADYLWTDVPGAISNIEYIPGKDGYISFKVNPDKNGNDPRGNTVIALYRKDTKEILWSWHIWMSDVKEVHTNGMCSSGSSTIDGFTSVGSTGDLIIMDRNLGATSANKNDGWKTYGLYYQMGKKDPYIGGKINGGSENSSYLSNNKYHADENIRSYYAYEQQPFGECTNHTEWNTNLAPRGWEYYNDYITCQIGYKNPMKYASGPGNDTRWTTNKLNQTEPFVSKGDHEDFWNRSKTINDPCPAGWTILGKSGQHANESGGGGGGKQGEIFGKPASRTDYKGNGVYGIETTYYVNGKTYTVWWPAAGFRSIDGTMGNVGRGGWYWYFDHIAASHGGHGWSFIEKEEKGYKYKAGITNGAPMTNHASSIRCVKAKQR